MPLSPMQDEVTSLAPTAHSFLQLLCMRRGLFHGWACHWYHNCGQQSFLTGLCGTCCTKVHIWKGRASSVLFGNSNLKRRALVLLWPCGMLRSDWHEPGAGKHRSSASERCNIVPCLPAQWGAGKIWGLQPWQEALDLSCWAEPLCAALHCGVYLLCNRISPPLFPISRMNLGKPDLQIQWVALFPLISLGWKAG